MLKTPTVFVIGAGAGCDFRMPLGWELAAAIGKKMNILYDGDTDRFKKSGDLGLFQQIIHKRDHQQTDIQKAAWRIRDAVTTAPSIDAFLDFFRDDKLVQEYGRAAIVKTLVEFEGLSELSPIQQPSSYEKRIDFSKVINSWLSKLWKLLIRDVPPNKLQNTFSNVTFVNFNYDRCLEAYFHDLLKVWGATNSRADEIMEMIQIFHPYGVIGKSGANTQNNILFGGVNQLNARAHANDIKLYTDQIADDDVIEEIRCKMRDAKQIIFLGFHFHEPNLTLIMPENGINCVRIFASAKYISDSDVDDIRERVWMMVDEKQRRGKKSKEFIFIRNNLDCAGLIDEYSRSIVS